MAFISSWAGTTEFSFSTICIILCFFMFVPECKLLLPDDLGDVVLDMLAFCGFSTFLYKLLGCTLDYFDSLSPEKELLRIRLSFALPGCWISALSLSWL